MRKCQSFPISSICRGSQKCTCRTVILRLIFPISARGTPLLLPLARVGNTLSNPCLAARALRAQSLSQHVDQPVARYMKVVLMRVYRNATLVRAHRVVSKSTLRVAVGRQLVMFLAHFDKISFMRPKQVRTMGQFSVILSAAA